MEKQLTQPSSPSLIQRLIRNKTFLLVFFSVVIILTTSALLMALTPQTPLEIARLPELSSPLPQPSLTSTNTQVKLTQNITFIGERPDVPSDVAVLRSTYATSTTDAILARMIEAFDLSAVDGSTWSKDSDTTNLVFLREDGFVVFETVLTETQPVSFSQASVVQATQEFMKAYLQSNPPESFPITYMRFSETEFELEPTSETTAQYAYVTLTPTYFSIPVRFKNHSNTENFVLFDGEYQPIRFAITPELYAMEPMARTKTLSIDTALKNISGGSFIVVDAYTSLETAAQKASEIAQTTFERVELEYRLDPSSSFYIPYYHFYGANSENSFANPVTTIEVITPAIELTP